MNLSKKYDELCQQADHLLKTYNPCDVKHGTCAQYNHSKKNSFCCGSCKHLTSKGCRVKSLSCKLWICREVYRNTNHTFKYKHQKLMQEAYDLRFLYMRTGKKETLNAHNCSVQAEPFRVAEGVRIKNNKIFLHPILSLTLGRSTYSIGEIS